MPDSYRILAVGDPREWSSQKHGGRFYGWPLTLEGVDEEVEWSRKTSSDQPRVGDVLVGDISNGPHGKKIKIDWDAMREKRESGGGGPAPSGASSRPARREYKPEHEFDPAKTARITRSHAQKVAVDLVTSIPGFAGAEDDRRREVLTQWIDWFESDVEEAAAQKTAMGAGAVEPTATDAATDSPAPTRAPDEDDIPF